MSAYLSAEGILSESLVVNDDLSLFDDYLFMIHLQRQYSASKELDEFLQSNTSAEDLNSESNQKYLHALTVKIHIIYNLIYKSF